MLTGDKGQFREALISSSDDEARQIIWKAKEELFLTNLETVEKIIVPALDSIGSDWHAGKLALSQVYVSGRICEEIVKELLPEKDLDANRKPGIGLVMLKDHHTLGKRIVASVLMAGGFSFYDYGIMSADELVQRTVDDNLELVMISVLMLSSAHEVGKVIENLKKRGCEAKVAVGGAPFRFDLNLWIEVGADAVGYTATDALKIAGQYPGGAE